MTTNRMSPTFDRELNPDAMRYLSPRAGGNISHRSAGYNREVTGCWGERMIVAPCLN